MTGEKVDPSIESMVDRAFDNITQDRVTIIQSYASMVIQKIDQLESTFQKSAAACTITLIIFFFITNQYLSDIEVGGVKIQEMQQLVPFFPLYLGYLFYMMCSSLANALSLEVIAKRCYELIAPGMVRNPLTSLFMIRTFVGSENQTLIPSTARLENWLNASMMALIMILLLIGSAVAMVLVSRASIIGGHLPPVFAWGFAITGGLLTLRGYVYFFSNMMR